MPNKRAKSQEFNDLELCNEEIERYARHLSLPEIGLSGQQKLKGSELHQLMFLQPQYHVYLILK